MARGFSVHSTTMFLPSLGIHHALEEGEVFGDKLLVAVLDEDAARVEVQAPVVAVRPEKVHGRVGDEEQGHELHGESDCLIL